MQPMSWVCQLSGTQGRYAAPKIRRLRTGIPGARESRGPWEVRQGLVLHMGHGLTYRNVSRIADIPDLCELNIGHSIVARAVMVGFTQAVREMKALITR
ncbi:MAG: pyridoxine 5'-phosphate synthase [Planctomycetaceae bacterium]